MKKLNLLWVMMLAVSAGFVSCEKDENDNPFDAPTIAVKATYADKTNADIPDAGEITAEEGAEITFSIRFSMGADKLSEVHIESTIAGKTYPVLDSVGLDAGLFNTGEKYVDFKYTTNVGGANEVLKFSTKDNKNRTASLSLTIKPTEPEAEGGFVTKEITIMGAQDNPSYGSFYSFDLGKVISLSTAKSDPSKVDFAYFYGQKYSATICAPADADGKTINYGTSANPFTMKDWTNSTKFCIVGGADGATPEKWYDGAITEVSNATSTKADHLVKDRVIAFKTQGNVTGAFVVKEISGTGAGYIKIQLIEKEK